MRGPGQPTLISANKLKTKYNINPQLDRIREDKFEAYRDIDSNTASSRVSLARKQRVRNAAGQAANELYGNKENIETNLINQDRRNQQSVRQFNAQQYNQYIDRKAAFDNGIREAKVTNINNLFSGINAGIQDMISRYENRKALNNTIGAMRASAPNVDDRIMRDAGVDYDEFIIRKRRKLGGKSIMPINFYTPTFRQQVNPIDLNVLARTYNTLEQGHQQAIQTKSQIDAQLAQLDLNEAEDAWRQEQLNKVRNALTENMQYGNAYSSLDDIVGTYGDITSSPGMIGRLRAQQDYKAYMNNLDKRTDLSEDYKNYYRAVNKYNYQDITDKNGNVIGGSKWTPIDKEVSEIPMNQILNQALQWAAKEQGGGSQTRWLDANGKVTDDITKSVTGEIYSHTKGNWQRLSKAKLAEAVKAVIENTPGAKASLEQDYKIAKWKYDQNGSNPDITDKNGILLTPEQYLAKRIDPFYNAATFYNQDSNTTYGEAWKAQLALAKTSWIRKYKSKKTSY